MRFDVTVVKERRCRNVGNRWQYWRRIENRVDGFNVLVVVVVVVEFLVVVAVEAEVG